MIAKVLIQTAARGNSTYLKNTYFTTPFKVANITEDKTANPLHLMLMNSSPGVLDGDSYELRIELDAGAALELHTQSYQRLFNMKQSAVQRLDIVLARNSSFCYLPHPSVPHAASIFKSVNRIYLQNDCRLVLGEILTCGRKLNGEVFQFTQYHNITEIYLKNKLVIKENLMIEPGTINLNAIGQLEGFTHQASLIYLQAGVAIKPVIEKVNEYLLAQAGIIFGCSEAPCNGMLIRILGHKAEQLHNCLKTIAGVFPKQTSNKFIAYAV